MEVAAYRIACESLTNVARHSHASHCVLTVTRNGALSLQVDDDGIGLPADFVHGTGTNSITERAAELGGSVVLSGSPMGGTRASATIPIDFLPRLVFTEPVRPRSTQ